MQFSTLIEILCKTAENFYYDRNFVIKAEPRSKNVLKSRDSGPIEIFGIIPKVSVMIEICSFSCKIV